MEKKIVINSCYGGFGLSYAGTMRYARYKEMELFAYIDKSINGKYILYDETDEEPFFINYTTQEINNKEELLESYWQEDIKRDDLDLVRVVEELGKSSYGPHAELTIVSIPEDVEWDIEEYDGIEWVAEKHRTWS